MTTKARTPRFKPNSNTRGPDVKTASAVRRTFADLGMPLPAGKLPVRMLACGEKAALQKAVNELRLRTRRRHFGLPALTYDEAEDMVAFLAAH